MEFKSFCLVLLDVEDVSSRNEMTEILAGLVKKISDEESHAVANLILGRVAPVFEDLEFNLAEKTMIKAISLAFDISEENVKTRYKELGDVGLVAEELRGKSDRKPKDVSLVEVYKRLKEVALMSGSGSQDMKIIGLRDLFWDVDPLCCRYIARIPVGKLRLGLSAKTFLDAISWSISGDKKHRKEIESAYYASSDLALVLEVFKKSGLEGLSELESRPGVPIFSKLVERIPTTEKIIEKMGPVWTQPKYDGLRCQVHMWTEDGTKKVRLFSRNLEDLTPMFPNIVEAVKELKLESLILDGELIGYNSSTEEFLPFQKTMQRRRKHGIEEEAKEIPVGLFVFDIMYLNKKEVMSAPIEDRIEMMNSLGVDGKRILITETFKFSDADKLEKYFMENVEEGLEGVIVKKEKSIYEPGTRNFEWVKLKRAMKGHLSDTVDVVIMGYYSGRGRQAKFGIGALLVGVRDGDKYYSIAKVGTGMTDEQWKEIYQELSSHISNDKPYEYILNKNLDPDVWVQPSIVSEIRADEITRSPIHTAGMDDDGVGYALRFPRMEVLIRDKLPEDCTSVKEVISMYDNQLVPTK